MEVGKPRAIRAKAARRRAISVCCAPRMLGAQHLASKNHHVSKFFHAIRINDVSSRKNVARTALTVRNALAYRWRALRLRPVARAARRCLPVWEDTGETPVLPNAL